MKFSIKTKIIILIILSLPIFGAIILAYEYFKHGIEISNRAKQIKEMQDLTRYIQKELDFNCHFNIQNCK